MALNLKLATRFLGVVLLIVCCSRPLQTLAADETAMAASKHEDHHEVAADGANQRSAPGAVSSSHKFTGIGKRSLMTSPNVAAEKSIQQLQEVDDGIEKRALPSSLRFTGLGKRRAGVGAAMRYAGLGKRYPEMPDDARDALSPEADYSETMPDSVTGLLDRRRRFAAEDFDDVMSVEDADGYQDLYGLRREGSAGRTSGVRYFGKRNKPIVKISSRIDPGMRYMGIGKRGYSY